jgi:hypothetical protein
MLPAILDWLGWERLTQTKKRHEEIIMKLSQLATALQSVDGKLTEASTEIIALIQTLRDQLGDVEIPADAEATLTAITTKATALADVVPNP